MIQGASAPPPQSQSYLLYLVLQFGQLVQELLLWAGRYTSGKLRAGGAEWWWVFVEPMAQKRSSRSSWQSSLVLSNRGKAASAKSLHLIRSDQSARPRVNISNCKKLNQPEDGAARPGTVAMVDQAPFRSDVVRSRAEKQ